MSEDRAPFIGFDGRPSPRQDDIEDLIDDGTKAELLTAIERHGVALRAIAEDLDRMKRRLVEIFDRPTARLDRA